MFLNRYSSLTSYGVRRVELLTAKNFNFVPNICEAGSKNNGTRHRFPSHSSLGGHWKWNIPLEYYSLRHSGHSQVYVTLSDDAFGSEFHHAVSLQLLRHDEYLQKVFIESGVIQRQVRQIFVPIGCFWYKAHQVASSLICLIPRSKRVPTCKESPGGMKISWRDG